MRNALPPLVCIRIVHGIIIMEACMQTCMGCLLRYPCRLIVHLRAMQDFVGINLHPYFVSSHTYTHTRARTYARTNTPARTHICMRTPTPTQGRHTCTYTG